MAVTNSNLIDTAKNDRSMAVNAKTAILEAQADALETDQTFDRFLHGDSDLDTDISSSGLIWHLKMNEGTGTYAFDSSSSDKKATITGNVTWSNGPFGRALTFGGTDSDYASATGVPALGNTWSMACWINIVDATPAATNGILAKAGDVTSLRIRVLSAGSLSLVFRNSSVTTGITISSAASAVKDNTWHHAAATHTGNMTKLFLDGVLVAGDSTNDSFSYTSQTWNVGRLITAGGPFNGSIDDVRLYTRCLGDTEVATLHSNRTNLMGVNDSIWYHYKEREYEAGDSYKFPRITSLDTYRDTYRLLMELSLSPEGFGTDGFYPPTENGTGDSIINVSSYFLGDNGDSINITAGDSITTPFKSNSILGYIKTAVNAIGDSATTITEGDSSGYTYDTSGAAQDAGEILLYNIQDPPGTQYNVTRLGRGLLGRRTANCRVATSGPSGGKYKYIIGADGTSDQPTFYADDSGDTNGFLGNVDYKSNVINSLLNLANATWYKSNYRVHLDNLYNQLNMISGDSNTLFTEPAVKDELGDTVVELGDYLSKLSAIVGDTADVVGDSTVWGYYNYFNAAVGNEASFNTYLDRAKQRIYTDTHSLYNIMLERYRTVDNQLIGDSLGYKGLMLEQFSATPDSWNNRGSGTGTMTITGNGEDFKSLNVAGYRWMSYPTNIPYDETKLYRLRVKVRRVATTDSAKQWFYCGIEGVAANGTTLVNINGNSFYYGQHYVCAAVNTTTVSGWTANEWKYYTGYFSGSAATGEQTQHSNPLDPAKLHTNVKFVRPIFIVNYNGGPVGNVMEIDYIDLGVLDSYVGDYPNEGDSEGVFTRERKWRLFFVKQRIGKPSASLINYAGLNTVVSITTKQLNEKNNFLNSLLGSDLDSHLQFIPTPTVLTTYPDPIYGDTGEIKTRRITTVYLGQLHATKYWIYRQTMPNPGATEVSNSQWGDTYKHATQSTVDVETGAVKNKYTDRSAITVGAKYIYRVRTFDQTYKVNGDTTASLQSNIFDTTTAKYFTVIGDSKISFGDSHKFDAGNFIVINGTSVSNGYYYITKKGDTSLTISPSITGDSLGYAYQTGSAVIITE